MIWPITWLPGPPATSETACAEVKVAAASPADPAAVEIMSLKLGAAPVVTAEVGTTSPCR